jgi:hypothetical protein
MTQPVWTTAKGSLGSINEREAFSKTLVATVDGQINMPNLRSSAGLKFTKVAGELPPGLELSPKGIIQGVPFEVATRKVYEFVVRVQDVGALPTIDIAERTFTIEVEGADAPIFATGAGQLDLSDSTSTITPTKWVIDGTEVNYQILATDTDTATGQTLVYDIVEGSLPTGLTMSPTGLISGVVRLAQDEKYGPRGGYAGDEDYDGQVWDRTVFTKSKSMNYEFKVRVTDGSSVTTQYNNIFVVTADWWRIDNTAITIDQTIYKGSPLTIDLSALRRPVFTTPSNLGAYRHDNQIVIRIDVEDFDPLQADLEYSIVSGSLPTGLSIDLTSGEIYGKLPVQAAVTKEHSFTIRAKRTVTSTTFVFTDKEFKLSVYGEIDVGVAFTTASDLGTVDAGIPSLKNLEATVAGANRVVRFTLTGGQLPPGLRLSPQGNIIGIPRINQYTVLDNNGITFDTNVTSFDREYTFTVEASDQYKALSTTRTFKLRIGLPYGFDYSSLQGHGTSTPDKNLFYSVAQDPNINNDDNIFRSEDKNFGVKERPEMLLVSGLKPSTLKTIQEQIELNHGPKTLYFGNLKTAVAKIDNEVVYEVVYIEMKDPMTNNSGQAVAKEVNLRSVIKKPILGPAGDDDYITADADQYNVTTSDGLSFSISGSKVRYANELSADLGAISKLFPNAVANMRSRIKDLGEKEYVHLPLWMRSSQPGSGAPLGYQTAMVIAYCKPGRSELVKARIEQKQLDFKKINFTIDRYVIGNAGITSPASFVGDGTTKEFTMNQIINSEDVNISIDNAVVAQATVDSLSLFAGNSTFGVDIVPATGILKRAFEITADNSELPTYLSADTTIRSADLQNPYVLTHDLVNKKTTITFSKAPQNKSKISVDYKGDKYLVFRRKGI